MGVSVAQNRGNSRFSSLTSLQEPSQKGKEVMEIYIIEQSVELLFWGLKLQRKLLQHWTTGRLHDGFIFFWSWKLQLTPLQHTTTGRLHKSLCRKTRRDSHKKIHETFRANSSCLFPCEHPIKSRTCSGGCWRRPSGVRLAKSKRWVAWPMLLARDSGSRGRCYWIRIFCIFTSARTVMTVGAIFAKSWERERKKHKHWGETTKKWTDSLVRIWSSTLEPLGPGNCHGSCLPTGAEAGGKAPTIWPLAAVKPTADQRRETFWALIGKFSTGGKPVTLCNGDRIGSEEAYFWGESRNLFGGKIFLVNRKYVRKKLSNCDLEDQTEFHSKQE